MRVKAKTEQMFSWSLLQTVGLLLTKPATFAAKNTYK